MEIATTTLEKETLEKQRQVEICPGLEASQEPKSTGWYRAKAMVVPLAPDQKLTEIR